MSARAQTLGSTNLLEGPAAGGDSVVLAANGAWTATTNVSWLHLNPANQIGTGSTIVVFSFDANSGSMRSGTLTIAGQTLTVTQAGSTYVAVNPVTTLVNSIVLTYPQSIAVDGAGNVYIASSIGSGVIKKWVAASTTVTNLVSPALNAYGLAVDGAGNVYYPDFVNTVVKKWVAASNIVTTLVSSGLNLPAGVAVDGVGNLYIANIGSSAILEWNATNNSLTTLVSSGLDQPWGVAVDGAGNVYIADTGNNAIKEWIAASNTVKTLVSSGINSPDGVAVDGAGHVYIADTGNKDILEYKVAGNTVTSLLNSGLSDPIGVAVDQAGHLYIADHVDSNAMKELAQAFVDPTTRSEAAAAGNDVLPMVLPANANLTGPFAPVSDSLWLTFTGATNGVVSFAFTANTLATNRTANLTLLGQNIVVTQAAVLPPVLTGFTIFGNGAFQFGFTNHQGASFTVWATTNLALPLTNWTELETLTNNVSGQYQFTDPTATNGGQCFYRVSSP
jgi:DNA-binding beta-propeller fold protein YncE